jgi:hypothetical protein
VTLFFERTVHHRTELEERTLIWQKDGSRPDRLAYLKKGFFFPSTRRRFQVAGPFEQLVSLLKNEKKKERLAL